MQSELTHPTITHLRSRRKSHAPNHFELRGGLCWWLVFDAVDAPPEFVGSEDHLPVYAREELDLLRRPPVCGMVRAARHINASLLLLPEDPDAGIPHGESVAWLRQYMHSHLGNGTYTERFGYQVVTDPPGDETYPVEIWESRQPHGGKSRIDLLDSKYILVWRRSEPEDRLVRGRATRPRP